MSRRVEPLTNCSTIGLATTMGLDNDEVARRYMQNLMLRGHHILVAHNWKIIHLKEFYPRSARLLGLNVNKGAEVCIRFREPGQKNTFLPFQEVLCTLLHEIAHCQYSRHDRSFWELYAQLVLECERLEVQMALSHPSARAPRFACGGRLGGRAPAGPALTPHLCAAAAAEERLRRARHMESCARDGTALSAPNESFVCGRCGRANPNEFVACAFCVDAIDVDGWDCARCAFHNYCAPPCCEACGFAGVGAADLPPSAVERIRAHNGLPHCVVACGVLAALADALAPLLHERRWRIAVLEELYDGRVQSTTTTTTTTASTTTTCSFSSFSSSSALHGDCGSVVRVRLRAPGPAAEFLPPAHAHCAALHQLAHRLDARHGVGFLVAWVALLLQHTAALAGKDAPPAAKEALAGVVGLTAQLERVLVEHFAGRITAQARLVGFLNVECRAGAKRARSPEDTMAGDIAWAWNCVACSFRNSGFLLCEVCGAAQPLMDLSQPLLAGTRVEPLIIE